MREMKDSGIEWIGEIPATWEIIRGKYLLEYLQKPVKEDDGVITCFRDGEVTLRSNRREDGFTVSDKEIGYQGIDVGDLVVHGMDGFAGAIGISDSRGKASPVLNVLDTRQNKRYVMYYLRSMAYSDVFVALATGIRVRSCDLRWNKLADLPYPIPTSGEQRKIVEYIDAKCAEIDALTADIQTQIDTLEQYKRSVITEAVTKGLNPDVEMKDSGIEWIGKIPVSWSFPKITHILDYSHPYPIGDGDHGSIKSTEYKDEGIPFIRVQNLGFATELNLENIVYISESQNETIKNSSLFPGDVLFAKTGATIGKVGIVPKEIQIANTTSHVGKITVSRDINSKFVFYVLASYVGYKQFWDIAAQKSTRPELSIDEIKTIHVLLPQTIEEQIEIVAYLDAKCIQIDGAIQNKKEQLVTLDEYKKSLIYEYVTGKKEVPENA